MDIKTLNETYNTEYTNRLYENRHIFDEIYAACNLSFMKGCGSYLFDGQTYTYCSLMYEKQELLYNSVKSVSKVLEIGTYMGHSLFIMLLSNPSIKITCIDIDDTYTRPAVNILNKYFNNAITFIHKDSLTALKNITDTFDFFHIDGHHENDYVATEFNIVKKLNSRTDNIMYIIFDDQSCMPKLQQDIEKYYVIRKKIIPVCAWNNIYYELQL